MPIKASGFNLLVTCIVVWMFVMGGSRNFGVIGAHIVKCI